ncbi:hypothetical protein [Streptomyces sp. NPDC058272]
MALGDAECDAEGDTECDVEGDAEGDVRGLGQALGEEAGFARWRCPA